MNVYVETNFVLELAFRQEQSQACEKIIQLGKKSVLTLVLPAYSLAEPHEKLSRQATQRIELQEKLEHEIHQLTRTAPYRDRINSIRDINGLLIQSNQEEREIFYNYLEILLKISHIIPLAPEILNSAVQTEQIFNLKPQDAIVYASVKTHLEKIKPEKSCFLNRNVRDFGTLDIKNDLLKHNCKMISNFKDGLGFICAELEKDGVDCA